MTTDVTGPEQLKHFLAELGQRCVEPANFYLFGGSAMILLGAGRYTGDIDYTIQATHAEALRKLINAVAEEFDLDVEESIPADFMPLPENSEDRHRLIGQFGPLTTYILDPYSMAVMKIDRSFKTDLQDVQFLVQANIISLSQLGQCIEDVASRYHEPKTLRQKFNSFKQMFIA
jgi:Nucleotidyltransferase of unknown function (DUF6036)